MSFRFRLLLVRELLNFECDLPQGVFDPPQSVDRIFPDGFGGDRDVNEDLPRPYRMSVGVELGLGIHKDGHYVAFGQARVGLDDPYALGSGSAREAMGLPQEPGLVGGDINGDRPRDSRQPELIDRSTFADLVVAVGEVARTDRERAAFFGVLRRAFDDVLEVEELYRELPNVLADDPEATRYFGGVIERAQGRFPQGGFRTESDKPEMAFSTTRFPGVDDGFPCDPSLALKPNIMYSIGLGIERVAAGDREWFGRGLATLGGLWQSARPFEDMYRLGAQPARSARERLGGFLRVLVRDTRGPSGGGVGDREGSVFGGLGSLGFDIPPGDVPGVWPPPNGGPMLFDLCALRDEECRSAVMDALNQRRWLPTSAHADGIISLSPNPACPPAEVTIYGSGFGAQQPADLDVVLGGNAVSVVSWSDTEIKVTIPVGAVSGPVGFVGRAAEALRVDGIELIEKGLADRSAALGCLGQTDGGPLFRSGPSRAPMLGDNYLRVGSPRIVRFLADELSDVTVTPGTMVTLRWQVENAKTVSIKRTSIEGPALDQAVGGSGILRLMFGAVYADLHPTISTYTLTATNDCGTVTSSVTVKLAQPPQLSVAIEVVQVVQTPANSVSLIAGKRTIVRAFVESGITNGFNSGDGPNVQPNVKARATVTAVPPAGPAVDCGAPIGFGDSIDANPHNATRTSLNFEMPLGHVSGTRRIDVNVFVSGHEGEHGTGFTAVGHVQVTFEPQATQWIRPFFLGDPPTGLVAPASPELLQSMSGARARLPLAESGFALLTAVSGTVGDDLMIVPGWISALVRLKILTAIFPAPGGEIWTALVPNDPSYALMGISTGFYSPGTRVEIARAGIGDTYAHEMCHLADVGHVPPDPNPIPWNDSRLPSTTDAEGFDVSTNPPSPVLAGRPELMQAVFDPMGWPSTALYEIMRHAFPLS